MIIRYRTVRVRIGRRQITLAVLAIALTFLLLILSELGPITFGVIRALNTPSGQPHLRIPPNAGNVTRALILPKTRHDDIRWVDDIDIIKKFTVYIYTTDRFPESQYLRPRTRVGRESAAYLSYILDNYDSLPEYSIFVHAAEDQWHNDIFSKGSNQLDTILNFRTGAVDAHGYVNLRCNHKPGCPDPMNSFNIAKNDVPNSMIRAHFVDMFRQLFDVQRSKVPKRIGNVCCAQFAVNRKTIQRRPREDYERMLNWAQGQRLVDDRSVGWMFEKVWHIIFGMDAIHCPHYDQCRCDNFGWCGPLGTGQVYTPAGGNQTRNSSWPTFGVSGVRMEQFQLNKTANFP